MQRLAAAIKPAIVMAENNLPSITTVPGFIFWGVAIYVLSWLLTILCGPLIVNAENEMRAK